MNRRINKIRGRLQARSAAVHIERAIAEASTPGMRDELIAIAQRHS